MKKKIEDAFKQEKTKLSNFIRSRISTEEDAEDILQDVFYKAVANANTLESVDNIIGWIYTVAKNRIIDWYRKKRLKTTSINNTINEMSFDELIEDAMTNVEDGYIKSLIYDEIIEAIDELPAEQKEVFIANEIAGVSFKELMEKTGVSINTLLSRKRYAVLNLKKKLQTIKDLTEK